MSKTDAASATRDADVQKQAPGNEPKCDHICLKDDGHVERGEPHFYGYENPSPRHLDEVRLRQDFERLLSRTDATQSLMARLEEQQRADFEWMQEIRDQLALIDGGASDGTA